MRVLGKLQNLEFAGVGENAKGASLGPGIPQAPDTRWLAVVDNRLEFQDCAIVVIPLLDHPLVPHSHGGVASRSSRKKVVLVQRVDGDVVNLFRLDVGNTLSARVSKVVDANILPLHTCKKRIWLAREELDAGHGL